MNIAKGIAALGAFVAMGMTPAGAAVNHPYFTIKHILPAAMENVGGLGGIGLLPNGDGVVCVWGGNQKSQGEVWIIPALGTGTPGTPTRIATGLREALGVAVVGADFYVMEKPRIIKFTGSGTTWTKSTFWTLPTAWYDDGQWHQFSFNLVYHDDAFWFTTGMSYDYNANDALQRGALIKVPLAGGSFTQLARGLREANGLTVGPGDQLYTTENNGHWKPIDALYWIPTKGTLPANGRFYGFRTNTNNACKVAAPAVDGSSCPEDPEYPPAIWMPYGGFSNSPARPILLKEGPYAGQMISGDIYHGGILRYFLEEVEKEWQGATFPMMDGGSAGVGFGVNMFHYAGNGGLLAAGIGGGSCGLGGSFNWSYNGVCRGLDLLTPTGTPAFEMLAIRSAPDGFDVEFTQPVSASAGTVTNWKVQTTVVTPMKDYGKDASTSDNNVTVAVSSATVGADGKRVRLKLASLLTKRMYTITVNGVTSSTGQSLFANVGYYTLNNVAKSVAIGPVGPAADFARRIHASSHVGRVALDLPFEGPWKLELLRLDGSRVAQASGTGPGRFESRAVSPGLYVVAGRGEGGAFSERIRVQ